MVRRLVTALSVMSLLALVVPAAAAPAAKHNVDASGIAIEGYDPVAYFEMGRPVKGVAAHSARHDGAIFRFASKKHREMFRDNPEKYLPAYGGYCAFGMRYGQVSKIDPTTWKIVDGRLFLQLNQGTKALWLKKPEEYISIADRVWSRLSR